MIDSASQTSRRFNRCLVNYRTTRFHITPARAFAEEIFFGRSEERRTARSRMQEAYANVQLPARRPASEEILHQACTCLWNRDYLGRQVLQKRYRYYSR